MNNQPPLSSLGLVSSTQGQQQGFTLLEVIVSMTMVAIVLGSLMAAMSGNRQLAFHASKKLNESLALRSQINQALLAEHPTLPNEPSTSYLTVSESPHPLPEEATEQLPFLLHPFRITDQQGKVLLSGTRWQWDNDS